MRTWRTIGPLLIGVACCAHADFESALSAYQQKDFPAAAAEFRRLAELGDAPSQRNLAVMHVRGEHVGKDAALAWAWAALAAQTDPEAVALRDAIGKRLSEDEAARAEQERIALNARFGPEAVRARLMPVPAEREADCTVDVTSEAKLSTRVTPQYPRAALSAGVEAKVCVQLYVARDGSAARRRVISAEATANGKPAAYAGVFSESAMKSLRDARFVLPATESLREVPASYCIRYMLGSDGLDRKQAEELSELKQDAVAGGARSQYELARLAEARSMSSDFLPADRKRLASTARQLYLHSAVSGYGPAQFIVARQVLTGDQCEKDVDKGLAWLELAAQQGQNDAAYLLASRLLHGDGVRADREKGLVWLETAAKGGHGRARIELARHWLRHAPERRAEALALLPATPGEDDIGGLEGAALAAALRGDYAQAKAWQRTALEIALELDFPAEHRRALLADFEAQKLPAEIAAPPAP